MPTARELKRVQHYLRSVGYTYEDAVTDIDAGVYDWLLGPRPKLKAWWKRVLQGVLTVLDGRN